MYIFIIILAVFLVRIEDMVNLKEFNGVIIAPDNCVPAVITVSVRWIYLNRIQRPLKCIKLYKMILNGYKSALI